MVKVEEEEPSCQTSFLSSFRTCLLPPLSPSLSAGVTELDKILETRQQKLTGLLAPSLPSPPPPFWWHLLTSLARSLARSRSKEEKGKEEGLCPGFSVYLTLQWDQKGDDSI